MLEVTLWPDVMIDLETLDRIPSAAITRIALVGFNPGTGEIQDKQFAFNMLVDAGQGVDGGATLNMETFQWWLNQAQGARDALQGKAHSEPHVAGEMWIWFQSNTDTDKVRVWGNGAGFDLAILKMFLVRNGIISAPWQFFNERCFRTLKELYSGVKRTKPVVEHDAYEDAVAQAKTAIDIFDQMRAEEHSRKVSREQLSMATYTVPRFGEPDLELTEQAAKLHPSTAALVDRFSQALKHKLGVAQEKYGWYTGWTEDDWEAECRDQLYQHLAKGDPLDVAAYSAFMWHHRWSTAPDSSMTLTPAPQQVPATPTESNPGWVKGFPTTPGLYWLSHSPYERPDAPSIVHKITAFYRPEEFSNGSMIFRTDDKEIFYPSSEYYHVWHMPYVTPTPPQR